MPIISSCTCLFRKRAGEPVRNPPDNHQECDYHKCLREDAIRWRKAKAHGFPVRVFNPEHQVRYWRVDPASDVFHATPESAIDAVPEGVKQ